MLSMVKAVEGMKNPKSNAEEPCGVWIATCQKQYLEELERTYFAHL